MFANRSVKNASDDKDNSMTPINSFSDAEAFSGRVVAFKTTSSYFGVGNGYKLEDAQTRYAVVDRSSDHRWSTFEKGPNLDILHNPKDVTGNNALINSKLVDANMQMRLATKEEICLIKNAFCEGKAKFDLVTNKREMIIFLDQQIRNLETQNSQRKPRI